MQDRLPSVSRRSVLSITGAALTGGAVVAFGGAGTSQAQVTTTELDVPNATYSGEDGSVSDITLSVSGSWQYTVDEADEYALSLMVSPEPDTDNWQVIDQSGDLAMSTSTAGQYDLSGSVLGHDAMEAGEFSSDAGSTTTNEIGVMVALDVIAGGEVTVSALAETSATVEVTNESVAVSAEVSGSGQLDVAV